MSIWLIWPIDVDLKAFLEIFRFGFMFVRPRDVPPICRFNVRTEMLFHLKQLLSPQSTRCNIWWQFSRSSKTPVAHRVVTSIYRDLTRNSYRYITIVWIFQNRHFPRIYHKMGVVFSRRWANWVTRHVNLRPPVIMPCALPTAPRKWNTHI